MIPEQEWIDQAKRVPLGSSSRVVHAGETRPNLVVYNNADSWSCWCHSCNDWGRVKKQHVSLVATPITDNRRFKSVPSDAVGLAEAPEYLRRRAVSYLSRRGLDVSMLSGLPLLVSDAEQRLLIGANAGTFVGRGIAGQKIKAITYSAGPHPHHAMHPKDNITVGGRVVLTEDYLSALKVRWSAPGWVAVSAQGTSFPAATLNALAGVGQIVLMLDGDDAGRSAATKMRTRLLPFVDSVRIALPPDGLDPKNLHAGAIRQLLETIND